MNCSSQDSQIKILTSNLMQKQDDLLELEKKVRKLNDEKVVLIKEKQEMNKQIDALEEQVTSFHNNKELKTEILRSFQG